MVRAEAEKACHVAKFCLTSKSLDQSMELPSVVTPNYQKEKRTKRSICLVFRGGCQSVRQIGGSRSFHTNPEDRQCELL